MEKEILLSELKGKFTKDFDTFGKMDPFLVATVGKSEGKTEVASDQGKNCIWVGKITLTYLDETHITIKSYDEDVSEVEYMGEGKIEIKKLTGAAGTFQVKIDDAKGENVGVVTGNFSIKELKPTPIFIVKRIKCDFYKELKFLLKSKPYVQIIHEEVNATTQVKENGEGPSLIWVENLRVKIKQNGKIIFNLCDKNQPKLPVSTYEANTNEFRTLSGTKRFILCDKDFGPLGVMECDYETLNFVTKEESASNVQKEKKAESELTAITIDTIRGELKKKDYDVYFKILLGSNLHKTETIKNAKVDFISEPKLSLYAESSYNKIQFAMYDLNPISDDFLGCSSIDLRDLKGGEKKIVLINSQKPQESVGNVYVTLSCKQVPLSSLTISNIVVSFTEGADTFGQSEPYVIAKIGGWSARTETGDGNKTVFKHSLELKFSRTDQFVTFEVWDEDLTSDEKMFEEKMSLSELRSLKGEVSLKLTAKDGDKVLTKGKLTFKCDFKGYELPPSEKQIPPKKEEIKKEEPKPEEKKPEVKKVQPEVPKKEEPKKEEPKKEEPKKEEPKKEEPKKEEFKKEEPKKEEPKKEEPKKEEPKKEEPKKEEPKKEEPKKEEPKKVQPDVPKEIKKEEPKKQQPKKQQPKRVEVKGKGSQRQIEQLASQHSQKKIIIDPREAIGDEKFLEQSKQTFRLPSVDNGVYGDRIFDKQSAATLQKSILVYSVPKASRFANGPKYGGEPSYYVDTCFKPNAHKGAGFGFGNKRQFPEWLERNMKENPSPGAYFDTLGAGQTHAKGPTFGIPHKFYEKVTIPKEIKVIPSHRARKLSPIRERI